MTRGRAGTCISARHLVLVAGVALGCGNAALAQTEVVWNNPAGGSWGTASNWLPAVVPANAGANRFNARITLDGTYAVALNAPFTVSALTLANATGSIDLNLSGRALTVLGAFAQTGEQITGGGAGNLLTLRGASTFNSALILQAAVLSTGTLTFTGTGDNDICDTDVDHRGTAITLNGTGALIIEGSNGRLTNGHASTFTLSGNQAITGAGGGRLVNNGRLLKNAGGGLSEINANVEFSNSGTIDVQSGTLRVNTLAAGTLTGTTLLTGSYKVNAGTTLDLVGASVTTLNADVTLSGAGSTFAAMDALSLVTPSGRFALAGGRSFTTAGSLTNNGTLAIGSGSDLALASGFGLTNFAAGTLTGGTYTLQGRLLADFGGADVATLAARLTLDGAGSLLGDTSAGNADRLANLARVNTGAEFTVRSRTFTTGAAAFTVEDGGRVTAGPGSTVSLGSLTNFAAGTLTDGTYAAQGTLRFTGAAVSTLNANLTLDGPASAVRNQSDNSDALAALATVSPFRTFTVTGGRDYATSATTVTLDGATLVVGKSSVVRAESATTFTFAGGVLDIAGDLRYPGAAFTSVPTGVLVRPGGRIINSTNGLDAFSALNLIQTQAQFSVAPGETRTLAGNLTSQSNSVLAIGEAGGAAATLNIPGSFNQAGATILGGGTLNVSGTYTLTGPTTGTGTINAGSIVLGTGGSIAAGNSPGRLDLSGDTAFRRGSFLTFEIGAPDDEQARGILNDFISFTGQIFLFDNDLPAGDVRYNFINAFTPEVGDRFVIAQASQPVFSQFARTIPFGTGIEAVALWEGTDLVLTVVALPSPGAVAPLALFALASIRRRR